MFHCQKGTLHDEPCKFIKLLFQTTVPRDTRFPLSSLTVACADNGLKTVTLKSIYRRVIVSKTINTMSYGRGKISEITAGGVPGGHG